MRKVESSSISVSSSSVSMSSSSISVSSLHSGLAVSRIDSDILLSRTHSDGCLGCRRCFSSTSTNRVRSKNYRFRRRTPSTVTFLDQFIKYTAMDGSLVVKAPFNLKFSGSHFDKHKKNIDPEKNKKMAAHKDKFYNDERIRRREEVEETIEDLEDSDDEEEEDESEEETPSERLARKSRIEALEAVRAKEDPYKPKPLSKEAAHERRAWQNRTHEGNYHLLCPDWKSASGNNLALIYGIKPNDSQDIYGQGIFVEVEQMKMLREVTEVERKILDQLTESTTEDIINSIYNKSRVPLHLRLYGRPHHRIDSYSILKGRSQNTHIYISDAASAEEAESMFVENGNGGTSGTFAQAGSVSIWRPKEAAQLDITDTLSGWANNKDEEVASAFKIHCPTHVVDSPDHGIKAEFTCPTLMNKLYLESERHGNIKVDCKLMDQIVTVGLYTHYGWIRLRDVWARDIKLASRYGDIYLEGTVEGTLKAETFGDGDFVAQYIVGPRMKVTTDSGDISLWNDTFVDRCQLFTVTGHIHVRFLYGNARILVKEEGSVAVNIMEGSLTAVVKSGSIWVDIDKLKDDSYLEMHDGNITVNLPPDFPFKVKVVASSTDIEPHILNSGELFLETSGEESFVKEGKAGYITPKFGWKKGDIQPTLSIRNHNGQVTITGARSEKKGEKGFDSS